ncbi:hypothetical protein CCH79_00009632 [Gambusia affinis]|uniref:Ig-like domain-containing protein n=1 Tax=Gambusia affinis TaxID=33528 RepID=A0A315W5H8_GAMAF|nr:hypothetical protein CCH79_00009632 [Gambusia affinis]
MPPSVVQVILSPPPASLTTPQMKHELTQALMRTMAHVLEARIMHVCTGRLYHGAQGKPSFIKTPEDQTGISGGVASFVCRSTGEPKPRITWMKKGKKVSSQRFEVIEFDDGASSVLRIQPLRTHRDEAIYECTATNSVGEINANAKLTVLEAIGVGMEELGSRNLQSCAEEMNDSAAIFMAAHLTGRSKASFSHQSKGVFVLRQPSQHKVHLVALEANESTAPQALTGHGWMGLLHVRRLLIPTLNELANGSPFTLTPFFPPSHIYTPRPLGFVPCATRGSGRRLFSQCVCARSSYFPGPICLNHGYHHGNCNNTPASERWRARQSRLDKIITSMISSFGVFDVGAICVVPAEETSAAGSPAHNPSVANIFMAAHDIHPLLILKTIRRKADMEMRQAKVVSSATVSGLPC